MGLSKSLNGRLRLFVWTSWGEKLANLFYNLIHPEIHLTLVEVPPLDLPMHQTGAGDIWKGVDG